MRTLLVGLGNPIVTDDGAGIRVVQIIKRKLHDPNVDAVGVSFGGLDLLELITGYDRLILIDTVQTSGCAPGSVLKLTLDDLGSTQHLSSPHDIGFKELIELGRELGLNLPCDILIYAIEAADTTTFGERCTPLVAEAIPYLVDLVIEEQFARP